MYLSRQSSHLPDILALLDQKTGCSLSFDIFLCGYFLFKLPAHPITDHGNWTGDPDDESGDCDHHIHLANLTVHHLPLLIGHTKPQPFEWMLPSHYLAPFDSF